MKIRCLLLLLVVIMFIPGYIYPQKIDTYRPAFWMYNFISNDTLTDLKLNSHLPLILNTNTNWYTKNRTKERNYLFIVYKSDNHKEDLVSIIGNKHALFISSLNVKLTDTLDISGYNQFHGELLDLSFGDVGNGILMLNNRLKKSNIYEVLLDNNLSPQQVNEIRTYLSIKYGIDLINPNQYTYKKEKLWNKVKNNDNIFGIGKFTYFNLLQKQSIHSKDRDFQIKFTNDSVFKDLKDGNFVLVGNNSKNLTFNKNTCSKKWTIQSNINTTIDILINSTFIKNADAKYRYSILVNGKKYESVSIDDNILFPNIQIDEKILDVELFRESNDFNLKIHSDCSHFFVEYQSDIFLTELKIFDDNAILRHDDLNISKIKIDIDKIKYFDIHYNFKGVTYKRRFHTNIGYFPKSPVNLNYSLDSGPIEISPKLDFDNEFSYTWLLNDIKISDRRSVILQQAGQYVLVITDSNGCSKEYSFYVLDKYIDSSDELNESWRIFPNPSIVNNPIYNSFNFKSSRDVEINIYSTEGKLVNNIPKKQIFNEHIIFTLPSPGTYMVVAYIDDEIQIKKIIVE